MKMLSLGLVLSLAAYVVVRWTQQRSADQITRVDALRALLRND
jgi:hypothetical protein